MAEETPEKPGLMERMSSIPATRGPRMSWKERVQEWNRVLQVARKPTKDEVLSASKISAAGIVIIGAIGLLIFLGFIGLGI